MKKSIIVLFTVIINLVTYQPSFAQSFVQTSNDLLDGEVLLSPSVDPAAFITLAPVDWNEDGLYDLVTTNDSTDFLVYLQQTDGSFSKVTLLTSVGEYFILDAVDWDDDGDLDLVSEQLSETNTTFLMFENDVDNFTNQTVITVPAATTLNNYPRFIDWDGDADLDIIAGELDENTGVYPNNLNFYENNGADVFALTSAFGDIVVEDTTLQGKPTPYVVDYNGDGFNDLIVGESDGTLNYYENDGLDSFEETTNWQSIDVGDDSVPAIVDWNDDGNLDLLVGNAEGAISLFIYDVDGDGAVDADDCDDADAEVYVGATEVCDGKDNDCDDSTTEENLLTTYYIDGDGDGFGDAATSEEGCAQPTGYVEDDSDCDDTDVGVYAGATEECDGIDNDCDGAIDEGLSGTCSSSSGSTSSSGCGLVKSTSITQMHVWSLGILPLMGILFLRRKTGTVDRKC